MDDQNYPPLEEMISNLTQHPHVQPIHVGYYLINALRHIKRLEQELATTNLLLKRHQHTPGQALKYLTRLNVKPHNHTANIIPFKPR